jgi:SAM-dependent methyltransferase
MFWYDKADVRALYMDKRRETFVQVRTDCGNKTKSVNPDILADFTNIPFPDNSFHLVVFDPPHVIRKEAKGSITMHYGHLTGNWKEMLRKGFRECFRVLKPNGTLIFKWSEIEIPLRDVLAMTPERPLFGHRVGRRELSHWCAFLKGGGGAEQGADVIERE